MRYRNSRGPDESGIVKNICSGIPAVAVDLLKPDVTDVFKIAAVLEDYTRRQIKCGEVEEAEKCFELVAGLLEQGGTIAKAFDTIYLYGINRMIDLKRTPQKIKQDFLRFFASQHTRLVNSNYP